MGIVSSKLGDSSPNRIARRIDADIKREKRAHERTVKLLLLGPSNSGKSTIMKQMKILHVRGFDEQYLAGIRITVYDNIIQSMAKMIKEMERFHIPFTDLDRMIDAKLLLKFNEAENYNRFDFSTEVATAVSVLWKDPDLQKCYRTHKENLQLITGAKYFFDNLERIRLPTYVPTYQDILMCRVTTLGAVELSFTLKGFKFKVVDVGGQKSERRKWIHCFEDVTSVIFITATNEYDQVMEEDEQTNRFQDSLNLFQTVSNSHFLRDKSFILFLNKIDLLQEKLATGSFKKFYPKYTGSDDYEGVLKFIAELFVNRRKTEASGSTYTHNTCATDTEQIQFVIEASIDIITAAHLKRWGLC